MKKIIGIFIVIILSFWSIKSLISRGYFPMHDDTQVARVVVMGKALKQGQFPVRWVSDLGYGYGYPIFNFYAPLPYYVGGGLYALGVDSVIATKIMFAMGMVLAPITLFLLVESILGFFPAIVASMLFLYAPYHAIEVYIRGSVGEYWSIAFVPLLLYGVRLCFQKKQLHKGIIIGSISFAGVIISHTILGFLTSGLLGVSFISYWIILLVQKKLSFPSVIRMLAIIFLGLGLSAFFWLPAIREMSYTSVSQMIGTANTTFIDHFVCIGQLWNSPWGFAGSAPGCVDGMSFKFGKVQVLALLVSFILWIFVSKKQQLKDKSTFFIGSIVALIICIFSMLKISSFLWAIIPFTSFIQYPWRLLSFAMMAIAICGAYIVAIPRVPIIRIGLTIVIVAITIIVNAKIFVPQYVYVRDSYAYETFEELRFTKSSISDEYLPPGIIKPLIVADIVKTTIQGKDRFVVKSLREQDTLFYVQLESDTAQTIIIKKAWFPGWKITVNGNRVEPILVSGTPSVNIPIGISIIEMQFTNTPVRTIGNVLSICAGIILGVLYVYRKKTNA